MVNKIEETFSYLIFSLQQYVASPAEILVGETEPVLRSQQSKNDQKAEGRRRFADLEAFPGSLVWALLFVDGWVLTWLQNLRCSYVRLRNKVVYIFICTYIIVIGVCLCQDGEELHLLTLPLSSFVKPALQKWSYKAKVSVSEKWWHCTCLLKL